MEKITARDVEARAREFIKERRLKVRRILLKKVEKKHEAWLIEGTVWFKRLPLHHQEELQASDGCGDRGGYIL